MSTAGECGTSQSVPREPGTQNTNEHDGQLRLMPIGRFDGRALRCNRFGFARLCDYVRLQPATVIRCPQMERRRGWRKADRFGAGDDTAALRAFCGVYRAAPRILKAAR